MAAKDKVEDNSIDIFDDFAVTDDGIWVPYRNGVEFLVARADNPKYTRRMGYFYRKNQRVLEQQNEASEAKFEEMTITCLAESILIGWKGTLKIQGEDLGEYSTEKAKKLLSVPRFREWLVAQSKDTSLYLLKQENETEKN